VHIVNMFINDDMNALVEVIPMPQWAYTFSYSPAEVEEFNGAKTLAKSEACWFSYSP